MSLTRRQRPHAASEDGQFGASSRRDSVRPTRQAQCADLESLVREYYERHPGETLEDLKRRASFSKEDKGLYRDWLAVAAKRAAAAPAAARSLAAANEATANRSSSRYADRTRPGETM